MRCISGLHTELFGSVLVSAGEGFSSCVLEAASPLHLSSPALLGGVDGNGQLSQDRPRRGRHCCTHNSSEGEPSLIYRPIGRLAYGVFADAGDLKTASGVTPATAVNIALLPPLDILPQMRAAKAAGLERAQISVNSFAVQLESVRRGMGVAVLPRILAKDLIELFPDFQLPDMEVYLVTPASGIETGSSNVFLPSWSRCCKNPFHRKCGRLPLGGNLKWVHGGANLKYQTALRHRPAQADCLRQVPGDVPNWRLKARLNAASDS